MLAREHSITDVCQVGSVVDGRYRVLGRLGRGGAGSIYAVEDVVSGKRLALKRLADDARPRVALLFEREYYTLSGLHHPNVVEVYDYGTYVGKPYYTMELLSGSDLSGIAPVAHGVALAYVRDAAKALAALHARHLIHRDVAPRNLWLSEDGGLKLLDFGALTSFGAPGDVVGTPPFVAPEALAGQTLDQRTDLYALGALLYWLLTGKHAYPARALRDLPDAWSEAPRAPSLRLTELGRDDLPTIPDEVDGLALALLSHDPSARPATAGEVIDRIVSLTGGTGALGARESAELIVARPAFAGRQRERKHFMRQLKLAQAARGGATIIEAERGLGTSRLLAEFSLEARLEGALTIHVDAAQVSSAGGTLAAIVQRLCEARPDAARRAFADRSAVLAALGPSTCERLGLVAHESAPGDQERTRIQDEVIAAVLALSRECTVVLLIDDLERAEDGTVAALADLAEQAVNARVLLVCALHTHLGAHRTDSVRALSRVARRLTLRALTQEDTRYLVRSILAEVPNLQRLVERVQRATRGNARHITELLRRLIDDDVIRQVDGTWVVPQELPEDPFQQVGDGTLAFRLSRLSEPARALGRLLSIGANGCSLAACKAIAGLEHRELFEALEQLGREGVLHSGEAGFYFADPELRQALRNELDPAAEQRAHLALGQQALRDVDASRAVRVDGAVHMLEGGDLHEAPAALIRLLLQDSQGNVDELFPVLPRIERALAIFRARGLDLRARALLLGVLVECGYFSDRKLAERYGDEACATLARVTGISLAARLAPYLGRALALAFGLAYGAFGNWLRRRDPCAQPFRRLLVACISSVTTMAGVSATCLAAEASTTRARLLRPLTGFGARSPLTFFADYAEGIRLACSDDFSVRYGIYQRLLASLDTPVMRRVLIPSLHVRYRGSALYMMGVEACLRESEEALAIANQLDAIGLSVYAMSAAQLRTLYYANRGELERYEEWRHRAELLGIKRGSAWQVETWMPGAMVAAASRSHDAMAMKHALEQLERLEKRIPSLGLLRTRAQGAYLMLRRRPAEALPFLEQCLKEAPRAVAGWSRAHGTYVSALNALGQHKKAREVSERILGQMDERTRTTWAMTVVLQIEHARAVSALGEHGLARAELERLVQETGDAVGAITRGVLQEALADVLRAQGEHELAERHFAEMVRLYRSTGLPSLAAHTQVLLRRLTRAAGGRETREFEATLGGTTHGQNTVQANQAVDLALGRDPRREVLAERTLSLLTEQAGSKHGGIWLVESQGIVFASKIGQFAHEDLDHWVRDRLLQAADDDVTQTDFHGGEVPLDPNQCELSGRSYQLVVMSCTGDGREIPVAAAVFERGDHTKLLSQDLLRLIGARLFQHGTLSTQRNGSSAAGQ